MKKITQYQSESGVVYNNETAAIKEDAYFESCNQILTLLPNAKDYNFDSGQGYLQCDPEKVKIASKSFLKLAGEYFGQEFKHVNGIVGRYISDSSTKAFNELSYRLSSIDSQNGMWGQIYYALNPHEGKQIQLN